MTGIIDVDFRYVMKLVPAPEWGQNMARPGPVLQWRKTVPVASEETKDMPVPYIVGYEWTDWQDVRTEEE